MGIYGVPRGVIQFEMRSATNTLATPDNLKRWKKTASNTCKMCVQQNSWPYKATLFYILNHSAAFLGTMRNSWFRTELYHTHIEREQTRKHTNLCRLGWPQNQWYNYSTPHHCYLLTLWPSDYWQLILSSNSLPARTYNLFWTTRQLGGCQPKEIWEVHTLDRGYQGCWISLYEYSLWGGVTWPLSLENKWILSIMHKLCAPRTKFSIFWKNVCKTSLLCSYSIYLSSSLWRSTSSGMFSVTNTDLIKDASCLYTEWSLPNLKIWHPQAFWIDWCHDFYCSSYCQPQARLKPKRCLGGFIFTLREAFTRKNRK